MCGHWWRINILYVSVQQSNLLSSLERIAKEASLRSIPTKYFFQMGQGSDALDQRRASRSTD